MEIWVDVKGYEGCYEVSSYGNVRSLERVVVKKNGVAQHVKRKILKPIKNEFGYLRVNLYKEDFKMKCTRVHRLVAMSFIPNPENKKTVNHNDGYKQNNRIENLEWATCSENCIHAYATGLSKGHNPNKNGKSQGEKNSSSKITESDVRYIRKNAMQNGGKLKLTDLMLKFGISNSQIYKIASNESWTHVI